MENFFAIYYHYLTKACLYFAQKKQKGGFVLLRYLKPRCRKQVNTKLAKDLVHLTLTRTHILSKKKIIYSRMIYVKRRCNIPYQTSPRYFAVNGQVICGLLFTNTKWGDTLFVLFYLSSIVAQGCLKFKTKCTFNKLKKLYDHHIYLLILLVICCCT